MYSGKYEKASGLHTKALTSAAFAHARAAILQIYLSYIRVNCNGEIIRCIISCRKFRNWCTMVNVVFDSLVRLRRQNASSRRRRTESLGAKCPSKERRRSSTSTRGKQFFCATLCVSAQLPVLRRHESNGKAADRCGSQDTRNIHRVF